jgi:predicted amidohydrolase
MYILSANRSNWEQGFRMIGASAVWSPLGEKLAEAPYADSLEEPTDEPLIIYADIDTALYANRGKERLQERKTVCYKELMQHVSPWDFTKSTESRKITAAILQCEAIGKTKDENFQKHKSLLQEAAGRAREKGQPLQLAVFPELATTGMLKNLPVAKIEGLAEHADGCYMQQYRQLAIDEQLSVVIGFLEKDDGRLYNSALLINDQGMVEGHYRKSHLSEDEKRWADAGTEIKVFETEKLGRIGLLIGGDAAFPEASGVLAVKRADTVIIPSNWTGEFGRTIEINKAISKNPYPADALCTWDSIALSTQAYVLVANSVVSQTAGGRSGLYTLDPLYGLDQPVIASANAEEALIVQFETLQSDWWFNQEKLVALRQNKEYKSLVV